MSEPFTYYFSQMEMRRDYHYDVYIDSIYGIINDYFATIVKDKGTRVIGTSAAIAGKKGISPCIVGGQDIFKRTLAKQRE